MKVHNCSRLVQAVSFIMAQSVVAKSGWFLDRYFTDSRTKAELLEFRKYMVTNARPLFYTGACVPPPLIEKGTESLTVKDMSFPVIKVEGSITGCDVDERHITPEGEVIPVGKQRYDEAFNWEMKWIFDSLRATHIAEAVSLIRDGGYVLHSSETEDVGVIDFGRAEELKDIDLTGTDADWSSLCANPFDSLSVVYRAMAKHKAVANGVDVIYSPEAWEAMKAHKERDGIKYGQRPDDVYMQTMMAYADVQYLGESNGGLYRHWLSTAEYVNHDGEESLVVEAGEILIISKDGLDAQRVFRTVTSDNKEELPDNANLFVYDDLDEEYDRKCRALRPWIEEYHLMIARNINGACVVKVVPEDFVACVACETCEDTKTGVSP